MKLVISIFFLAVLVLAEPLLFSDYLEFFIEGNKKIPIEYREKFLDIPINCKGKDCPDFIAKEFLFERPDKTMMVYEMKCGAGGLCEIQKIIIYDNDNKLVGHFPYKVHTADCGFDKIVEATYVTDSLLCYQSIFSKKDCDTEKSISKEIKLTYVDLTSLPFRETNQEINATRKYWNASTQILENSFIDDLPLDTLDYIRNEIFASKGYVFKTTKWKDVFDKTTWYKPSNTKKIELTIIEKINVENLLKRKEN